MPEPPCFHPLLSGLGFYFKLILEKRAGEKNKWGDSTEVSLEDQAGLQANNVCILKEIYCQITESVVECLSYAWPIAPQILLLLLSV